MAQWVVTADAGVVVNVENGVTIAPREQNVDGITAWGIFLFATPTVSASTQAWRLGGHSTVAYPTREEAARAIRRLLNPSDLSDLIA